MFARLICCTVLALCATSSSAVEAEKTSGVCGKHAIEGKMAEWLAHPLDLASVQSVQFKRTFKADLITYGRVEIHLVEYRMPDGWGRNWPFRFGG